MREPSIPPLFNLRCPICDGAKGEHPVLAPPPLPAVPVLHNFAMAFMVPVMKKDFDLYKNRRISESVPTRKMSADNYKTATSLCTSPSSASAPAYGSPSTTSMAAFAQRMQNRAMTRTSSRASQNSLVTSPTRAHSSSAGNSSSGCSPPKAGGSTSSSKVGGGSQGSLNKFHCRLVDKLKRSLRRETSTEAGRSWEDNKSIPDGCCKDAGVPVRGKDDQPDDDEDDEGVRERRVRLELTLSERTDQLLLSRSRRRDRSPSTSSLPVVQEIYCSPRRATVVANESVVSLIGSDSALLVKDKPPLPRFSRMMMMATTTTTKTTRKKKSLQPRGMDPDDSQQWKEEVKTSSSKSTGKGSKERNVFSGALAFFKARWVVNCDWPIIYIGTNKILRFAYTWKPKYLNHSIIITDRQWLLCTLNSFAIRYNKNGSYIPSQMNNICICNSCHSSHSTVNLSQIPLRYSPLALSDYYYFVLTYFTIANCFQSQRPSCELSHFPNMGV